MLVQEVYQVILNNQKPRPGHFLQSQRSKSKWQFAKAKNGRTQGDRYMQNGRGDHDPQWSPDDGVINGEEGAPKIQG